MDNSINEKKLSTTEKRFTLRGPLTNLKNKSKNKTYKLLNNFKQSRKLAELYITYNSNEDVMEMIDKLKTVNRDIISPIAEISFLENSMNINILTNSKKGTFIYSKNTNTYFNNLGKESKSFHKKGTFLRRGAGSKLLSYAIDKLKDEGIKTIVVYPDDKELEKYYSSFGFIPISKVPFNIVKGKITRYYENNGGRLMIKKL